MRPPKRSSRAQPGGYEKPSPRVRALIPITLIDASTRANAAAGLQALAAGMRAHQKCHAHIIMLFAQQIADSYSQAQAVANYTDTPAQGATAELTAKDAALTEVTLADYQSAGQ